MEIWIYYLLGIIILPGLIYASIVQSNVNTTFEKYKKLACSKGYTAAEAVEKILHSQGIYNVKVVKTNGHLTDNFNPKTNTISLSSSVYNSTSISALGVAAHEAGHAIQYAEEYAPMKIRTALIKVNNFCSALLWPMFLFGGIFLLSALFLYGKIFLYIGLGLYLLSFAIELSTYPVEKNASKRALDLLVKNDILDQTEVKGSKAVLSAAAKTYLASLIVSILYVLRFVLAIVLSNRD